MVDLEFINPGTPVAGPYSPMVIAGNLIFVSGQVPAPDLDNVRDQTASALEKIKSLLKSCGSNVGNIVKTTVYLKDMEEFKEMNDAYKDFFKQNGIVENFPARSTIQASPPLLVAKLEIDAIATR
ncbi:MAG: RidA family protein [Promethearchaeota archaeon]